MKRKLVLPLMISGALAMSISAFGAEKHMALDYKDIENSDVMEYEGHTLFPVRAVADAMGLSVEWKADTKTVVLSNGGPLYVTFSAGIDGYTFAKTAPMPLGCAPVIVDGKTYAPIETLTELMSLDVMENEESFNIITKYDEETAEEPTEETTSNVEAEEETASAADEGSTEAIKSTAIVTEISDDGILINDSEKGEVMLVPNDDTVITFEDGTEAAAEDMEAGSEISVVYGEAMTLSLPPINNPVSITIIK